MHPILLGLTVVGILTTCDLQTGFAQQQLRQFRPVTITYRSTTIVRTQWSPDSANPNASSQNGTGTTATNGANPNEAAAPAGTSPGRQQVANGQPNQFSPGFSSGSSANGSQGGFGQRPTNQQLQNPSGGFNMTHSGFSQSQYMSPNNYFGPQYHVWSNLHTQPTSLAVFESFNRYQPDINSNSGAYYSPNTYIGAANNQWSNLSNGSITPNDLGGWNYSP